MKRTASINLIVILFLFGCGSHLQMSETRKLPSEGCFAYCIIDFNSYLVFSTEYKPNELFYHELRPKVQLVYVIPDSLVLDSAKLWNLFQPVSEYVFKGIGNSSHTWAESYSNVMNINGFDFYPSPDKQTIDRINSSDTVFSLNYEYQRKNGRQRIINYPVKLIELPIEQEF